MKCLTSLEVVNALQILNTNSKNDHQWTYQDGRLVNQFVFDDFLQAFSWMTKMSIYAEELNHHPDWCNSYNVVNVKLVTHEKKAITRLDIEMAEKMSSEYAITH